MGGIWHNKCPRCRKGDMFKNKNPYRLKKLYAMYERCSVCGQKIELQPGFWYISNYITYSLCGILSLVSFLGYWILIGISWRDNSLFYWMGIDAVLIAILAPLFIRFARSVYLSYYVKYDPATKAIGETKEGTPEQ